MSTKWQLHFKTTQIPSVPVGLREVVVGLVFPVFVEVEDALDEVLAEHGRVLLQQQVDQTELTQTRERDRERERQRETDKDRERGRDRGRDRGRETQTKIEAERHRQR